MRKLKKEKGKNLVILRLIKMFGTIIGPECLLFAIRALRFILKKEILQWSFQNFQRSTS